MRTPPPMPPAGGAYFASTNPNVVTVPDGRKHKPVATGLAAPRLTPGGRRYAEAEQRWQAHLRRKAGRHSRRDHLDLVRAKRARLGPSPGDSAAMQATKQCVTCKGTGKLRGRGTRPLCKGSGRVPASAGSAMAAPGRVNMAPEGGGGAGASEGGQMSGEAPRSARADLHRAKAMRARIRGSDPTPQLGYDDSEIERLGKEGKALAKPRGGYWFPILNLADLTNALAAYKQMSGDKTGVRAWIVKRAILLGLVEQLPKGWAEPKVKLHPNEISAGQTV